MLKPISMEKGIIKIILIEDDSEDFEMIMELMKQSDLNISVSVFKNGVEALTYLLSNEVYRTTNKPDLVLLDLNMPKMNGLEFIENIKKDEVLRLIPVIILTSSADNEDVWKSYYLGASCYIVKPVGIEKFQNIIKAINDFWFSIVKFPPKI